MHTMNHPKLFVLADLARAILVREGLSFLPDVEDNLANGASWMVYPAAEEICQRNPLCDYFPSYEIITGNYAKDGYFESDLRSIKSEGVEHVMRLFLTHYAAEKQGNSFDQELMRENALVSEVVCDEEAIDVGVADKGVQKRSVPFINLKRLFSRVFSGKNISG